MNKKDLFKSSLGKLKKKDHLFKLKYQIDKNKEEELRIFGESFVRRNNMNYKIIYNNKMYKVKEYFEDINKQ